LQETLGREPEWSRKRANAELRERLVRVEREGYRKPEPASFESFARGWAQEYPAARGLKRSTAESYRTIIESHLIPAFGSLRLTELRVERVEGYLREQRAKGLGPASLNRHLNVLSLVVKSARRKGLVRENLVTLVDRPKERQRWRILSPVEARAVQAAFEELIAEAEGDERAWREQARVVFLTLAGTGLRRGELLGPRWRAVRFADPDGPTLRVEETVARGRIDTPKSEAGERTIALGPVLAGELFEQRARSCFDGDGERVFCHPAQEACSTTSATPRRCGWRLHGRKSMGGCAPSTMLGMAR
jgi:integrase